jgi:hypothetical protein
MHAMKTRSAVLMNVSNAPVGTGGSDTKITPGWLEMIHSITLTANKKLSKKPNILIWESRSSLQSLPKGYCWDRLLNPSHGSWSGLAEL